MKAWTVSSMTFLQQFTSGVYKYGVRQFHMGPMKAHVFESLPFHPHFVISEHKIKHKFIIDLLDSKIIIKIYKCSKFPNINQKLAKKRKGVFFNNFEIFFTFLSVRTHPVAVFPILS